MSRNGFKSSMGNDIKEFSELEGRRGGKGLRMAVLKKALGKFSLCEYFRWQRISLMEEEGGLHTLTGTAVSSFLGNW